ncbi:hypothetical protein JTB14_005003 [Gonioctena quinquepunctata]|nr:hypothetical protein JTB14_005003 [Gonioctena quinquepunctata]
MVRKYKRKVGSRPYCNYTEEMLNAALRRYERGNLTQLSEEYDIPYVTLYRKIKGLHPLNPGNCTALSLPDEKAIVKAICIASEWGFPFEPSDIKDVVQDFFTRRGQQVEPFVDNRPGEGWMEKFLHRHEDDMSKKIWQSIKQSQAKIDHTTINGYFHDLSRVLKDVHPEAIVNYDETNFTDDPGRIKVIVRKQSKRAEKVMDTSKSSTSVMFSRSAPDVMLPPYIVYKADHLWSTWMV